MFGTLRIRIFGKKKWKIWKYQKLREKKSESLDKSSFDKNGPNNNYPVGIPTTEAKAVSTSTVIVGVQRQRQPPKVFGKLSFVAGFTD